MRLILELQEESHDLGTLRVCFLQWYKCFLRFQGAPPLSLGSYDFTRRPAQDVHFVLMQRRIKMSLKICWAKATALSVPLTFTAPYGLWVYDLTSCACIDSRTIYLG